MRLGPKNILEYNAKYHVLICRECAYAIQKSAVQSHLLRHKIYREERQRLLKAIGKLDIIEPDDVPLPEPDTPPIEGLAVVSGYKCTVVVGCDHLCASTKRMQRHWREVHGLVERSQTDDAPRARPVRLQTFFRGTKIRYFEVASLPGTVTASIDQSGRDEENDNVAMDVSIKSLVDLETLNYFHHFVTKTSPTLPGAENCREYWHSDFVKLALQHRWMMCGLLAISASHLATLTDEEIAQQTYRQKSDSFYSEFSVGLDRLITTDSDTERMTKAGTRVKSVLCCAKLNTTAAPSLESLIRAVKDLAISLRNGQNSPEKASARSQTRTTPDANRPLNTTTELSSIFTRLCVLPYRMAEIFGKPDDARDAIAILSAITALIECYNSSLTTDEKDISSSWHFMTRWLSQVPAHFDQMVVAHNPSALVVLAYWVALLIERAEKCPGGLWFLKGLKRVLQDIIAYLPADADGVRSLVEELL